MQLTNGVGNYWAMVLNGYSLLCLDTNTGYAGEAEYKLASFFVFAHHLTDHLIEAEGLGKSKVWDYVESSEPLRRCSDICDATKHFELYRAPRSDVGRRRPDLSQLIRVHAPDRDVPGTASVHNMLTFEDGTQVEALTLASDVVLAWRDFGLGIDPSWLKSHGLS